MGLCSRLEVSAQLPVTPATLPVPRPGRRVRTTGQKGFGREGGLPPIVAQVILSQILAAKSLTCRSGAVCCNVPEGATVGGGLHLCLGDEPEKTQEVVAHIAIYANVLIEIVDVDGSMMKKEFILYVQG